MRTPELRPPNILGNYLAGRGAALGEQNQQRENALAERRVSGYENQLAMQGQEMTRNNALQDQDRAKAGELEEAQHALTTAQYILQSKTPLADLQQTFPDIHAKLMQTGHINTDQDALAAMQRVAQHAGAMLGQGPAVPFEQTPDYQKLATQDKFERGQIAARGAEDRRTAQAKPASGGSFRPLSKEEIAAAGLPPGSSAQVDTVTGKIDVMGKRDTTGVLSQKDATTAKIKLTTIKVARQQLNRIKKVFEEGRQGMNAYGPGQGLLPTQAGKKFDAAVDQMRSSITALTRTPGVGSMSDYETKLDQSKFPKRSEYETVTDQKLQGLDDLLNTIESGYSGLLSGESPTEVGGPQQGQAPAVAIAHLQQHPELAEAFRAKYGYLPNGG